MCGHKIDFAWGMSAEFMSPLRALLGGAGMLVIFVVHMVVGGKEEKYWPISLTMQDDKVGGKGNLRKSITERFFPGKITS